MKTMIIVILMAVLSGCAGARDTICGGANAVGYLGAPCFFLEVASDLVGSNKPVKKDVQGNLESSRK